MQWIINRRPTYVMFAANAVNYFIINERTLSFQDW